MDDGRLKLAAILSCKSCGPATFSSSLNTFVACALVLMAGKTGNAPPAGPRDLKDKNESLQAQLMEQAHQNEKMKRLVRKYEAEASKNHSLKPKITIIPRPAGERSKAWGLQEAMGYTEEAKEGYLSFLRDIRAAMDKVGIDMTKTYRQQDPGRLYQIMAIIRNGDPDFAQYPGAWPVKEAVQQALNSRRSYKGPKVKRNGKHTSDDVGSDSAPDNATNDQPGRDASDNDDEINIDLLTINASGPDSNVDISDSAVPIKAKKARLPPRPRAKSRPQAPATGSDNEASDPPAPKLRARPPPRPRFKSNTQVPVTGSDVEADDPPAPKPKAPKAKKQDEDINIDNVAAARPVTKKVSPTVAAVAARAVRNKAGSIKKAATVQSPPDIPPDAAAVPPAPPKASKGKAPAAKAPAAKAPLSPRDVDAPTLDVDTPILDADAPTLDANAPILDANAPILDANDASILDADAPGVAADTTPKLAAAVKKGNSGPKAGRRQATMAALKTPATATATATATVSAPAKRTSTRKVNKDSVDAGGADGTDKVPAKMCAGTRKVKPIRTTVEELSAGDV